MKFQTSNIKTINIQISNNSNRQ